VARHQRVNVEFAGTVETGLAVGDLLAQQPIGADDLGRTSQTASNGSTSRCDRNDAASGTADISR
jgi:hypothetical protein